MPEIAEGIDPDLAGVLFSDKHCLVIAGPVREDDRKTVSAASSPSIVQPTTSGSSK